jgi:hypothetical protein
LYEQQDGGQEQSPRNFEGNWFAKFYKKLYL